jgi:ribosomal-protein-alanine N-acetyltransferase
VSALILIPAVPAHADVLAQLHAQCFEEAWDEGSMQGLLATPGTFGVIGAAGEDSAPIAFAMARRALDEAEILSIGVIPDARGLRLGQAILTGLLDQARRNGVRSMFLEVAADNNPAIALYRGAGFEAAGLRKGYYTRKGSAPVDAHVLRLVLAAGP